MITICSTSTVPFLTSLSIFGNINDVSRAKTFNLKVEAREVEARKSSQSRRIYSGALSDEKPCQGVS